MSGYNCSVLCKHFKATILGNRDNDGKKCIPPGGQPRGGLLGGGATSYSGSGMIGGNERGQSRIVLRKSFGNQVISGIPCTKDSDCKKCTGCSPLMINKSSNGCPSLTPFRRAMNAGDIFNQVNSKTLSTMSAPNQVNNIKSSQIRGLKQRSGSARKGGKAAYTGNPRYVYDRSDYTRFKKLQTQNRNYNDYSFGGYNNSSYVSLMHVRH